MVIITDCKLLPVSDNREGHVWSGSGQVRGNECPLSRRHCWRTRDYFRFSEGQVRKQWESEPNNNTFIRDNFATQRVGSSKELYWPSLIHTHRYIYIYIYIFRKLMPEISGFSITKQITKGSYSPFFQELYPTLSKQFVNATTPDPVLGEWIDISMMVLPISQRLTLLAIKSQWNTPI